MKTSFLPTKGAILAEFQDVHLTESTPNLPNKGGIDKINDQELEKRLEQISQFVLKIDTDMSIWQFKRNTEEEMNMDILESRQKKIILKWKNYSDQSRRQRVRLLKQGKQQLLQK